MSTLLALEQVSVSFGYRVVLRDISLSLAAGEIGSLLGASGSGKSTLLRAIAGFEPVRSGCIIMNRQETSSRLKQIPPHLRGIGMVFQDHALFPHLTVEKNIGFGLMQLPLSEKQQRVSELLQMIGLSDRAKAYPHHLSGGQQQRVALARALAPRPCLLLLDEPFASLDTELRRHLAMEVRSWLQASGTAALLVTHDQQEAFAMADRIGVLVDGMLQQWDSPYTLYHQPANTLVARFVGEGVLLPATVLSNNCLRTAFGDFCALQPLPVSAGSPAQVLIRPDDVIRDDSSATRATVVGKQFRGAQFLYTLRLSGGEEVLALFPSHQNVELQQQIGICLELEHLMAFPVNAP